MSTSLATLVQIRALAELSPASPLTGAVKGEIVSEQRTTNGQGSGQADRAYFASRSLSASATHTYNVLAAGSLTDLLGQAIDLDEIKGLAVECLTGAIKVVGGASNALAAFTGAARLPIGPLWADPAIREQFLGAGGDAHVVHRDLALFHQRAGAPAAAVDHLLVGEHRLVDRIPVDHAGLLVRDALLQHPQEQPLVPAVVGRVAGRELARPVDGEADGLPGLIVDRYADTLSVQLLSAGTERWRDAIATQLGAITGLARIYERSDSGVRGLEGLLHRCGAAEIRLQQQPGRVVGERLGLVGVIEGVTSRGSRCPRRTSRSACSAAGPTATPASPRTRRWARPRTATATAT